MRIDERDIMFSRMAREKNSDAYDYYYKKNPHLKAIDDEIRSMPEMDSEDTAMYKALDSPIVTATFDFLADIKHLVDGPRDRKSVV